MTQITYWILVLAVPPLFIIAIALLVDKMAENGIFFTKISEGEIIVVMHSGIKERFIGRIEGYWVDSKTGQVWKDGKEDPAEPEQKPRPLGLPSSLYGIYFLGMWPFAKIYTYRFHWNKYAKEEGSEKYDFIPRDEDVDSIYFKASYPVRLDGAETKEGVPLTVDLLITTQTVNADTALFKIKSPGWLAAETAAVHAVGRDFVGSKEVAEINKLKVEIPVNGAKSELQLQIESLNTPGIGNPSIRESFGQKIVSVNFLGYSIDAPTNDLQRASIAKYMAERESDKVVAAQIGERAKIDTAAKNIRDLGAARGDALKSEAEGLKKKREAVEGCPELVGISMAEAIRDQKTATTLIVNSPSPVPTIPVK